MSRLTNSHIRVANADDFQTLSEIWLEASLLAHDFIPASHWQDNKIAMQEVYLPAAQVYLLEDEHAICGFIAVIDQHIEALFVAPKYQGQGMGKRLLEHVQQTNDTLMLNVYQDNVQGVRFYTRNHFKIMEEGFDEQTNAADFVMIWQRHEHG